MMKLLVPRAITETALIDSSAGAMTVAPTPETVYPVWVAKGTYDVGQRFSDAGVVYECIKKHKKRTTAPASDPRFWKTAPDGTTLDAWVSGTTYAVGDRVSYAVTHRIYKRLTAGAGTTTPNLDTTNWLDIGPTNPWAMFDESVGTRTSATSPLTFTLQPGIVNTIAMLNIDGASTVRVHQKDGVTTISDETVDVGDQAIILNWYDYFFEDIITKSDFVLESLLPYSESTIEITVTGPASSKVAVGACVVGNRIPIGLVDYGAELAINDFSIKETDAFGTTKLVERTFNKRNGVDMMIDNDKIDYLYKKLTDVRAVACVWYEDETDYEAFILYGFYKGWTINLRYTNNAYVTLRLEGLS